MSGRGKEQAPGLKAIEIEFSFTFISATKSFFSVVSQNINVMLYFISDNFE